MKFWLLGSRSGFVLKEDPGRALYRSVEGQLRWTPHPVTVAIRDNGDYNLGPLIFLLYHCCRAKGPPQR